MSRQGKMSGSPFHVEYVSPYQMNKSEPPERPIHSEFNSTMTRCSLCIYYTQAEQNNSPVCTNLKLENKDRKHCSGFLSVKEPNAVILRQQALEAYNTHRNHRFLSLLSKKLLTYKGGNSYIDSLLNKRWFVTGSLPAYNKEDIYRLIKVLKGSIWDGNESWKPIESDFVISLGNSTYKLTRIREEISRNNLSKPLIIQDPDAFFVKISKCL